jgi:isopenicillin N synthase-like dioxygenase
MYQENIVQPSLKLQRAFLQGEEVIFEENNSFYKAIEDGFFLLEIPGHINLTPGIKLAESFYQDSNDHDPYKNFKRSSDIYFDREHFQTEHILLDQHKRAELFPRELKKMCDQMNEVGIKILKNVCLFLGLPKEDLTKVMCGTLENKGTHWFACSHYRSERDLPGCAAHKDTGFVTVLYVEQTGLEAFIDKCWQPIEPRKGYFIINFGASLEILTANIKPSVRAILHRVRKINSLGSKKDRFSFASFLNPSPHLDLYQYSKNHVPQKYMPVKSFLDDFNKKTWNDRHDDFGIRT